MNLEYSYDCLLFGFDFDLFLISVRDDLLKNQTINARSLSQNFEEKHSRSLDFDFYENASLPQRIVLNGQDFKISNENAKISLSAANLIRPNFHPSVDRVFLEPLSYLDRELLLHELTEYWVVFFSKYGAPEYIVFESNPHFPVDIALLGVCQVLKIKILSIQRTLLQNRIIVGTPLFLLPHTNKILPLPKVKIPHSLITKNLPQESDWLKNSKKINEIYYNDSNLSFLLRNLQYLKYMILSIYFSLKGSLAPYWNYSRLQYIVFTLKLLLRKREFRRFLNKVQADKIPEVDFIYFPLHFQPERTTVPEANQYWSLYESIKTLSMSIPTNWKIVVREHPRQIEWQVANLRVLNYRSIQFYRMISRLSNVIFISPLIPPEELIHKCKIVSTCTGSTAWEALQVGRPSLIFSNTFYSSCDAIEVVSQLEEIPDQIDSLLHLREDNIINEFRKLVDNLESMTVESSNFSSMVPKNRWDIFKSNLANEIINLIKQSS